MAVPNELLEDVKSYLDITWDLTDSEQSKLTGIIERGMKYLNFIAGRDLEYTKESMQRSLLFDYVRYVRSNALDELQKNYLHELLALQIIAGGEVDDSESNESSGI